jgi:thioesterase domain-containing protein
VPIRKGGDGKRPFFCVHGAGGNLLNFRDFAQLLSADQPVYGLEARGVDGQQPPAESIEEMATLYLESIRTVQPHGPYLLGGYSGGGVVALEMARMLERGGERVEHVVLLDTFHPSAAARGAVTWREKINAVATHGLGYAARIVGGIILRHTAWRLKDRRLRDHLRRGAAVPHDLREWYVSRAFLDVLKRHVPAPYAGPATLFRAQELGLMYQHIGPRLGWDETLLPALTLVEVPGNHDSLVREPNVRVLAAGLEDLLQRAAVA